MKWKQLNKRAKKLYKQSFPYSDRWRDMSLEWKRFFYGYVLYQKRQKHELSSGQWVHRAISHDVPLTFDGTMDSIALWNGEIEHFKSYDRPISSDEIARDFLAMLDTV